MTEIAPQGRGPGAPPPIGVVFNTAMNRPDAALALALLYALADQRQARIGAVCVSGAGLDTAVYCDTIGRFFVPLERNSNQMLPVGLAVTEPMPADPPMIKPAVQRKTAAGEPQYVRSIQRVTDTSQAEAVLRNGVIFSAESVVVLSAPATSLARTLDLAGVRQEYVKRVRRLVIADNPEIRQDLPALSRILNEWPTPVVVCRREVGAALAVNTDLLDQAFAGFVAHPVVDAYRAFKTTPYDLPLGDLAAVHYAVRPDGGLFVASAPGTLSVANDGTFGLTPDSKGTGQFLSIVSGKDPEARGTLLKLASATPTPPAPARGR